jgi:hypothetical protein
MTEMSERGARWFGAIVAIVLAAIIAFLVMEVAWMAVVLFLGLVTVVFVASWKRRGLWSAIREALMRLATGW